MLKALPDTPVQLWSNFSGFAKLILSKNIQGDQFDFTFFASQQFTPYVTGIHQLN